MLSLLVAGYGGLLPWAPGDITWGIFNVPEQQAGMLGDVRGLDVVELGCGTHTSPPGWPGAAHGRPGGHHSLPSSSPPGAARTGSAPGSRSSRPAREMSRCLLAASTRPSPSAGPALWSGPARRCSTAHRATPDPPSSPRSCVLLAVTATTLHQTPPSQRIPAFLTKDLTRR